MDCVDREVVINAINRILNPCTDMAECITLSHLKEDIERLPAVEPERPKGKWIVDERMVFPKCSCCKVQGYNSFDFCPMCGADMRGDSK